MPVSDTWLSFYRLAAEKNYIGLIQITVVSGPFSSHSLQFLVQFQSKEKIELFCFQRVGH